MSSKIVSILEVFPMLANRSLISAEEPSDHREWDWGNMLRAQDPAGMKALFPERLAREEIFVGA
jgi:hypothetical protein